MSLEQVLLLNLLVIGIAVVALWVLSLICRDASIVDFFWGTGFVIVAWTSLISGGEFSLRTLVLAGLISFWGIRLSGYLFWRNWGKPEDYRYQSMREHHGDRFKWVSLFTVFGLQGVLMWFISLPIQVGMMRTESWNLVATIGTLVCLTGILFESVGDYQLARFKADPSNQGRVMNRGLWRYTRHPNYFGDFLVWWGIYFVSAEPQSWWWTILGPLLMTVLLVRVSGVRLLENSLRTRIDGYGHYVETTSAFFPWPPKQSL